MKTFPSWFSCAGLIPLLCLGVSIDGVAQVSNPFGKSLTETQTSAGTLGSGEKKGLPTLGEKSAKKGDVTKPSAVPEGATEITAKKGLQFDQKGNQAVFVGDVVVIDPRFSLNCDKLTAVLKRAVKDGAREGAKEENAGGAAKASGSELSKGGATGPEGEKGAGGIEKAIAEGNVSISQEKRNDKGELERSVGRAQKAVYDADTGDITLSGWPQLEQKMNTIVALEESTVIVMNRKGKLDVQGHSKTVLRDTKSDDIR